MWRISQKFVLLCSLWWLVLAGLSSALAGVTSDDFVCNFWRGGGCGLVLPVTSDNLNISFRPEYLEVEYGNQREEKYLQFYTSPQRYPKQWCAITTYLHHQSPCWPKLTSLNYDVDGILSTSRDARVCATMQQSSIIRVNSTHMHYPVINTKAISYHLMPNSSQSSTCTVWLTSVTLRNCRLVPPPHAHCSHEALTARLANNSLGYECRCPYGHKIQGDVCVPCGCVHGEDCGTYTGLCYCAVRFAGRRCQVCAYGYSGTNCSIHCDCLNGATCVLGSSVCQCLSGFYGIRCEKRCGPNRWGIGCTKVCNCLNGGRCDVTVGCVCVQGFNGVNCSNRITCPPLALPTLTQLIRREGLSYLNQTVTKCRGRLVWVSGQQVRVCQEDNTWSGSSAVCRNNFAHALRCKLESHRTTRGSFVWPESDVSTTRVIACPYAVRDRPVGQASRRCIIGANGMPQWQTANTTTCPSSLARTLALQQLRKIQKELLTAPTSGKILYAARQLLIITPSHADEMNDDDVAVAVDILSTIATATATVFSHNITTNSRIVDGIVDSVVRTSSLIAASSALSPKHVPIATTAELQSMASSGRQLVKAIEKVIGSVPLIDADQQISSTSANVAVMSVCPDSSSSYALVVDRDVRNSSDFTFTNISVQASTNRSSNVTYNTSPLVSFTLPAEALSIASQMEVTGSPYKCQRSKANFVVYSSASLFHSPSLQRVKVVSKIVSARAGAVKDLRLLSSHVEVRFQVTSNPKEGKRYYCAYWNFSTSSWREDGCNLTSTKTTQSGTVGTCRCNHLTHFAMLLRPPASRSTAAPQHVKALRLISLIGCGVSAVCLAATSVTIFAFSALRKRLRQKLTLCLALSLLCSLVLFSVSELASGNVDICQAVGMLLHFFLLVSFCWMTTQAVLLYKQLVVVFDTTSENFFRWSCLLCFSAPAAVVGVTAASTHMSAYKGQNDFCFLSTNTAFFVSFLTPMLLLVVFNTVVTLKVTAIVVKARRSVSKQAQSASSCKQSMFLARVSLSLSILAGVTWLLGGMVPFIGGVTIQYFFAVTNSLQGAAIFYFYTLTSEEVRTSWSERYSSFVTDRMATSSKFSSHSTFTRPRSESSGSQASASRRLSIHSNWRLRRESIGQMMSKSGRSSVASTNSQPAEENVRVDISSEDQTPSNAASAIPLSSRDRQSVKKVLSRLLSHRQTQFPRENSFAEEPADETKISIQGHEDEMETSIEYFPDIISPQSICVTTPGTLRDRARRTESLDSTC